MSFGNLQIRCYFKTMKMLTSAFELFLVFVLLGTALSEAQKVDNNTHSNDLNFFPSNKKLSNSSIVDESKETNSKKTFNSSVVSADTEATSSEIVHSGFPKKNPLEDSINLTEDNLSDVKLIKLNNNNTTDVGSKMNVTGPKKLKQLSSTVENNETKKTEFGENKMNQLLIDVEPIGGTQMVDDTDQNKVPVSQNDLKDDNPDFAEESLLSIKTDEELQVDNDTMDVRQNLLDEEEVNDKQNKQDDGNNLAELPSSDSNDNFVNQASDTIEENVVQQILPDGEKLDMEEDQSDNAQPVPSDTGENEHESKNEMDLTNFYDDDEKLSTDNEEEDNEELEVNNKSKLQNDKKKSSQNLNLPFESVNQAKNATMGNQLESPLQKQSFSLKATDGSESGDWNLDSDLIPVVDTSKATTEVVTDESVEEASGDDLAVSEQALDHIDLPKNVADEMTTTLRPDNGQENPSLSSELPQTDSSIATTLSPTPPTVKVSSASKLPAKVTTSSTKPPLASSEESPTYEMLPTTLYNEETVPNSWLKNAEDYGKAVLDKYGTGQVVGIVIVVFFSLALFLCCMCRCRTRGKYRRLRKLKDYGKEKDFLLSDKKLKGVYHTDRLTLLDETSEDDL